MAQQPQPNTQIPFLTRRSRRRVRQTAIRFITFALLLTGVIMYFARTGLTPTPSDPHLSAQPAPQLAQQDPRWLTLPAMNRSFTTHAIGRGEALIDLLRDNEVPANEAHTAVGALSKEFDPRRLMPEQEIRIFWESPSDLNAPDLKRFAGFDLVPEPTRHIVVRRMASQVYIASSFQRKLTERHFLARTLINSSVYEAARASGMAPATVIQLIRMFSYNIDFQRDIREGDQFEVLYTRLFDSENNLAEEGDILYAALTNQGRKFAMWAIKQADGGLAYYDAEGVSARRLLMKTPVDGARLSSRFGKRRHPILGYTRLHRGLDFAAPSGTPIYAAGNGQIVEIGRKGDFGNYIRIRHSNGYETAYAHMLRFSQGLKKGGRVSQGQIIGRVGASGLATGPHLHYEVILNGKHINPRTLALPAATALDTAGRARLNSIRSEVELRIRTLSVAADTRRAAKASGGDLN
jgi:murein DD-endopeptidase MepM/ murein hydrolase activator NlpD